MDILAEQSLIFLKTTPETARILTEAFRWFKKAAEQGKADAQLPLARAYRYGKGVEEKHPGGDQVVHQSGRAGEHGSHRRAASLYLDGEGIEKDVKKAAEWFIKAAEQGDPMGELRLRFIWKMG